jgi:hypothetical protein
MMQIQNMPSFDLQGLSQGAQLTALSDNQKEKAKEILAQYDMENFSQEDRLSVRKELHAQGIKGKAMQEMLKELPKAEEEVPLTTSSEEIKEAANPKAVLMQLLQQRESGEMEEKDFSSQLAELKLEAVGSVLNIQA